KGWDARKRAYCLKIQPATGSFARNLIYSTKPSSSLRVIPNLFATWFAQLRACDALCARGASMSKTFLFDDECDIDSSFNRNCCPIRHDAIRKKLMFLASFYLKGKERLK
ncbi:hypothetical protein KKZ88_19110, partial [Enterobacter roggenkampii]